MNKPKLREKFGILDEWVLPFKVCGCVGGCECVCGAKRSGAEFCRAGWTWGHGAKVQQGPRLELTHVAAC